jgi:hypothetical protein
MMQKVAMKAVQAVLQILLTQKRALRVTNEMKKKYLKIIIYNFLSRMFFII